MAASRAGKALPWIVLVLILVGFGAYEYRAHRSSSSDRAASPQPTPTDTGLYGVVTSDDLPVTGACYETHPATSPTDDVTPQPKPCDGLHNTVAVAQQKYPDPVETAYDQQAVADEGEKLCDAPSDAFVGRATATFSYFFLYPARESWESGDRIVACLVRREGPDVVGPLTQ